MVSRVRDSTRTNPLEFHGSKVEENPQEFIEEVYKVLMIMGITPMKWLSWPLINLRMFLKYGSTNGKMEGRKMRASRPTLFGVGHDIGFHVKLTWSMSVRAYSHHGPRPTFTDRESAPRAMVLPVVLEAMAPLLCTSHHLVKARQRSLPRTVVMTTVRGDSLGHDLALWRQGLQALVPSDVHEPPLSLVKCTTARSGARGALGSSYLNNPQLPKS
ncbi:hypothetical protein MTR67_018002 [Solanum verrucosum]|uniref:Gag-pol polyprotein n=1 Tax=Solanum verrucosum TaxID=315347 RepID=A0AAF0QKX2_SOLVR|nr:hypothetical protein MTR67_018002 [Solanum verrucosum]